MTTSSIAATAVVVGVDGSAGSVHALQWAAADAARRNRPLHLLYAHTWPGLAHPPAGLALPVVCEPDDRVLAAPILADAVAQAHDIAPALCVSTEISAQLPVPALWRASQQASLVVVGSRGMGGFAALLVGSTSTDLAMHAGCPVVVVRDDGYDSDGPDAGRVVVGIDGSHSAELALGFAFEQAAFRGAGLTAVTAAQWQVGGRRDGVAAAVHGERDTTTGARRVLAETLAGWHEKYPEVDVRSDVRSGRAGGVLADASAGASLLVVGARGRGGVPGALLGSVSQAVLHHAHCPVAVVRRFR